MHEVDPQLYTTVIREMFRHENDVTNHRVIWWCNNGQALVALGWLIALFMIASTALAQTDSTFVRIDPANTTSGYLARLLINEVPFPGERAYVSEAETQGAMMEVLGVLHARLRCIPTGYRQEQVAGVRSTDIVDVICGTGERRQCEGFYRNASGQFVTAPRVEERLNYLLKIANSGGKPGRFANLLNFGQELARAYTKEGIAGADRYARLTRVGQTPVTGRAYSWMTDVDSYHPGGNYVSIPNSEQGSLGGNRFFTLRKTPK
jgi:hypothetical protein